MTCEAISPQLVAFHFGEADDRAAVEAHLLACPACLREFLDLKRAIEAGGEAPSEASRVRLRAAVAALVAPPRRRWHRPVALAFALSALVASAAAMQVLTTLPK